MTHGRRGWAPAWDQAETDFSPLAKLWPRAGDARGSAASVLCRQLASLLTEATGMEYLFLG